MDDMTNPSVIKRYAQAHGFYLKKSMGQNFLIDGNIARRITNAACLSENDYVLEIGPGAGALTQYLINDAKHVFAVEMDSFACKILQEAFSGADNLTIINQDILKCELTDLLKDISGRIVCVSNLPYYITSPIIMKLLKSRISFESIIVMLQKEAAMRLRAKPGTKDYSSFTIAVEYYAQTQFLFDVPKSVFMPVPKVDSAVMKLSPRKQPFVDVKDVGLFFDVLKAGFAMRRKTLANCLNTALGIDKIDIVRILGDMGLEPACRGEKLTIQQFALLSDKIYGLIEEKKT